MKTIYRHYGNEHFEASLVKPIKNRDNWGKPYGGLWASRVDAEVTWKEWCESENYETQKLSKHFDFTLKDGTKILEIKNVAELDKFGLEHRNLFLKSYYFSSTEAFLDFEKLSKLYDAIEVNAGSNRDLYFRFYGWDCDSIVIFNSNCVEGV